MEYMEFKGKTKNDAITEACRHFSIPSDRLDYEVVDEGKTGFLGMGARPAIVRARVKEEEKAKETESVTMGIGVEIAAVYDESQRTLEVDLSGDEMGVLIGKRGQTLDSLQYLISLVVNKGTNEYIRVKVDTENYRQRRKETLENLAKNIAYKVKRTRRPVSLEPMNPYERRIIHSALQNDRYVTTHSEGDEPFRRVVVTPKRESGYNDNRGYRGNKFYSKGYNKNHHGSYNRKNKPETTEKNVETVEQNS